MKVYAVDIEDIFPPAQDIKSPAQLINRILPSLFLLAGILMFLFIIGAGFMMIQGASSGDAQQTGKGKQAATYAIIGFILIFVSYWIIKFIASITGIKIL